MIKQMDVTPEVASALANLRLIAQAAGTSIRLRDAINALDDAGVFAEIDERYDYASPADVLHEIADASVPNTLDPAEWGDTTSADVARRQGVMPTAGTPLTQESAASMFDLICTCSAPTDGECIC